MKSKPDYYGWGSKQGSKVRTWKTRYFVLRGRELAYFSGAARDASGAGAGEKGRLRVVDVDYAPDRKHGLLVHGENKQLKMTTTSAEESRQLFRKIKQAVGKLPPSPRTSSKAEVAMAGWLLKEEPRLRTWKRRYVTLHRNEVTYYADAGAQPLATDVVHQVAVDDKSPLSLQLRTTGGVVHVAAETREDIERWDHALAKALGQPAVLRQVVETPVEVLAAPDAPTAPRKQSMRRCEGWLEKLGQHGGTWKKRYFMLTESMLEYRKGPMESLSAEIFVTDVTYSREHADALEIKFGADHSSRESGSLCVRAESIRDLDKWMFALCDAVGKPRLQLQTTESPPSSPSSRPSDSSSSGRGNQVQLPSFRKDQSPSRDDRRLSIQSSQRVKTPPPTSPSSMRRSSEARSVAAPASSGRVKRGWLYKQGYYTSSWKLRYFVLDGGTLNHYKHASGSSKGHGVVKSVSRSNEPAGSLEIQLDGGNVIKVYGETKADTDAWYATLKSRSLDAENSVQLELQNNQGEDEFGEDNSFHGWLLKKGQNWKSWKRRYFVLERSRLAYSADVDSELLGSGVVFEVAVGEQRPLCIDIRFQNGRLLHVVAPTEASFGKWFAALQTASNLAESFLSQSQGKIVFDDEFDNDAGENETGADMDFTKEDILMYSRTIGSDEGAALWIAAMENKPEFDSIDSSGSEHGDDERESESLERLSDVLPRASDASSTISQSKGCLGWLKKEGGNIKNWKRRYFTLYGTKLSYYKSEKGSLLRSVRVTGVTEQASSPLGLEILTLGGRTLVVQAESQEDFSKWLHAIQEALVNDSGRKLSVEAPIVDTDVGNLAVVENGQAAVTHSGWLEKEGQRFKTWKRRYFTFKNGALIYYGDVGGVARGHGRVVSAEPDYTKPHTLKLTFRSGKTMRVTGANDQEVDAWLQVLSRGRSSIARTTATSDLSDDLLDSEGEDEEAHSAPLAKRLDSTDYFSNDTITNDSLLRLRDQQGKETFLQSFEGGNHSFKGELVFQEVEEEKDDLGMSTNGVEYYRELLAEDERVQGERESERLARKGEAPIAGCAPCCIVM